MGKRDQEMSGQTGELMSLDEAVWSHLILIVQAAHSLRADEFHRLSQAAAAELGLAAQQKAGLYLWFLLRHALGGLVGGKVPTDSDLKEIAHSRAGRFASVVKGDEILLEDTFRKVFERRPVKKDVGPGGLVVLGAAALGVLYDDPERELAAMKPKLNSWWLKHSESMYSEGMLR